MKNWSKPEIVSLDLNKTECLLDWLIGWCPFHCDNSPSVPTVPSTPLTPAFPTPSVPASPLTPATRIVTDLNS